MEMQSTEDSILKALSRMEKVFKDTLEDMARYHIPSDACDSAIKATQLCIECVMESTEPIVMVIECDYQFTDEAILSETARAYVGNRCYQKIQDGLQVVHAWNLLRNSTQEKENDNAE